jgi:DNA (cytosine-5)-methyltransferase 1
MPRPKLLDLFCCSGGASVGYRDAGFDVTGVDLEYQSLYPLERFYQADALDFVSRYGHKFDAIAASPPCQGYSAMRHLHPGAKHPMLIEETRAALEATGKPYIIENVVGAPLRNPVTLCGSMFNLGSNGHTLKRHRLFESNVPLTTPADACKGKSVRGVYGSLNNKRDMSTQRGIKFTLAEAREAMGTPWLDAKHIVQAIPPAYTEHLGRQLIEHC